MSNQRHWALPMQNYISDLLAGSNGTREKNFNMRWLAAMVGDVHRVLMPWRHIYLPMGSART